jgi:hypothetical protein
LNITRSYSLIQHHIANSYKLCSPQTLHRIDELQKYLFGVVTIFFPSLLMVVPPNYVTDSMISVIMPRYMNDREQKEHFRNTWKVSDDSQGTCGNVRVVFNDNKAILSYGINAMEFIQSYDQISSHLALYRTISLFQCGLNAAHSDFYKMNWYVQLEHSASGQVLGLGEWKGAFQIFTPYQNATQIPEVYKTDCEALLTYLVSQNMTINYDGTVAGSVA